MNIKQKQLKELYGRLNELEFNLDKTRKEITKECSLYNDELIHQLDARFILDDNNKVNLKLSVRRSLLDSTVTIDLTEKSARMLMDFLKFFLE